jgi:hypothetical protein
VSWPYLRAQLIHHRISHAQELDQPGTPQHQALHWVVEDSMMWNRATSCSYSNVVERMMEQYVLVVMYLANQGIHWKYSSNFLSLNTSICTWNNNHADALDQGAFCDDEDDHTSSSKGWNGKHIIISVLGLSNKLLYCEP